MTVGYETQFEYSGNEPFCDMISIFWQWIDTVGYPLTLAMIVYLPYKIYEQFKGDPFPRLSRSKCLRVAIECFFIFIVLAVPLTYILPSLHCKNFLLPPQLCRMSLIDRPMNLVEENCTHIPGLISSLSLSLFVDINLIGIFVIIICCILLLGLQVQGNANNTLSNAHLAWILCCIYFTGIYPRLPVLSLLF